MLVYICVGFILYRWDGESLEERFSGLRDQFHWFHQVKAGHDSTIERMNEYVRGREEEIGIWHGSCATNLVNTVAG